MTGTGRELTLVEAASEGDESAFEELVTPRRGELHAHCYRMLGSTQDADEALQESLLRAWRGLRTFESRSSVRSWLFRIATNVSLSAAERRPPRMLPLDHGPAAEAFVGREPLEEQPWLQPYPDAGDEVERRETLELAFVAALQLLPGNERAALLMREVLGFSAAEAADALGTTPAAINSALQRARRFVDERGPRRDALLPGGDAAVREVVAQYVEAMRSGDVEAVLGLLVEDATWSMPPLPEWFAGRAAIGRFLVVGPFRTRTLRRSGSANGQPAVAAYQWDEDRRVFEAFALDVLSIRGGRIESVTGFLSGVDFERFGFSVSLPAEAI